MSAALSIGEIFLLAGGVALLFAAAHVFMSGAVSALSARSAMNRALDALYTEMTLNTRALERWSFEAAKARRDGAAVAFAARRAVFDGLGEALHQMPKPALEKALDFYALLASLERLSAQAALRGAAESGEAHWALRAAAEEAAAFGRAAQFSFEIEGAVAAVERPRAPSATESAARPPLRLADAA